MLNCMNCKNEVPQQDAKVFAAVFVCPKCYTMALRLFERSEKELKGLLVMLTESIRIALLKGELQFAEGRSFEEVPKTEVLQAIVALNEKRTAMKGQAT